MALSQEKRDRNPRGQGDRLREVIADAAMSLIDETSAPASVTLRAVARRAGISAPSIYAHFADLQAVLDEVLARGFAELDSEIEEAMADAATAEARLVAGCLAYVQYGWTHRSRYRFMITGDGFAPDAVATFERIEAALRGCVEAGVSSSTDPRADAFLLWVGMHGMATLEKPAREDLRRLGPLDRPALALMLVRRLARLEPTSPTG